MPNACIINPGFGYAILRIYNKSSLVEENFREKFFREIWFFFFFFFEQSQRLGIAQINSTKPLKFRYVYLQI